MNCYQCGKHVRLLHAWLIDKPGVPMAVMCGEGCLRAWLGPDRPLSRRVEEAETVGLSPQHIVVRLPICPQCGGHNSCAADKCPYPTGLFKSA